MASDLSTLAISALEIEISGVHSDPDPSPGVGIGRSLREAFAEARLIAVDYSVRSSGLHHPVFDEVRVQPVWSELDLLAYADQIRAHLSGSQSCRISGLDVEVEWLADTVGEHPRLLVPSTAAQRIIRKPELAVAGALRMRVPEFIPAVSNGADLHAIGRRSGWRLWVKGKYHEAYPADGFAELRRRVAELEAHWPLADIFVQRHISGLERAIMFVAYEGRLLDAVAVEKRVVTARGKTWAAAVSTVPPDVLTRLVALLADAGWTGGGEVEFVRDTTGDDWLIDFNPRFPAYVHGVTLCGHNMPAQLVGAALGREFTPPVSSAVRQFVRVVHEIPVRKELPLPALLPTLQQFGASGKHPSSQPALVRRQGRVDSVTAVAKSHTPVVPPSLYPGSAEPGATRRITPARVEDEAALNVAVTAIAAAVARCAVTPRVIPALSVKTDPHPSLARAFLDRGWWAEVISLRELDWARRVGFREEEIVFNGPLTPQLATESGRRVGIAFADSTDSFEALLGTSAASIIGLRIRPSVPSSRFGIDLTHFGTFRQVVDRLRCCAPDQDLGVHMHLASDTCGPTRWMDLLKHTMVWADALSQASGRGFAVFDIGGGWHADDFREVLLPRLSDIQAGIATAMPSVGTLLLEPGKAVASDRAWLVTRVVEVRDGSSHEDVGEIVVDASIADLPMAPLYAHHILHVRDGCTLGWLGGGRARVLGGICMETDILATGVSFPERPQVGDELAFSSAGGYNASMAWNFANGVSRDT